jgi:hypothetical protein
MPVSAKHHITHEVRAAHNVRGFLACEESAQTQAAPLATTRLEIQRLLIWAASFSARAKKPNLPFFVVLASDAAASVEAAAAAGAAAAAVELPAAAPALATARLREHVPSHMKTTS